MPDSWASVFLDAGDHGVDCGWIYVEDEMKFTEEQALAIMGYTGVTTMPFDLFHADVEKRLGRPIFTHEFGNKEFAKTIVKDLYRKDFINMCRP